MSSRYTFTDYSPNWAATCTREADRPRELLTGNRQNEERGNR